MSLKYSEFIDLNYVPSKTDIIATFYVKPAPGISIEDAAARVASESSVGTWTELRFVPSRVNRIKARVFEIDKEKRIVKIAYPIELFELDSDAPPNIPQFLSSVAGNIFGMKAIEGLKLLDIHLPKEFVKHFPGPQFGISGVRKIMKVEKRPITATVPKPKVGFSAEEFAKVAYELWIGGIDLCKDDENLTNLSFNKFKDRVLLLMKMREKVEEGTGERKSALINITAETREMLKRAKFIADNGGEFVMIDIITVGWAALQTVRYEFEDLKLAIHAHRAMHAAFTRNREHGISMLVVTKLSRLIGVDHLHSGTAGIGKMESEEKEVLAICDALRNKWFHIKRTFPVASGGLHPGILPNVMKIMGTDIIVQVGGGVFGHPSGIRAGAEAVRAAIDAFLENVSLEEKARESKALFEALQKWGAKKPL